MGGGGGGVTKLKVLAQEVQLLAVNEEDYICLTDIARYKDPEAMDDLIRGWIRNRNTIEFLGIWEQLNNPGFTLTPKQWFDLCGRTEYGLVRKNFGRMA
jgi:hypothetical protein